MEEFEDDFVDDSDSDSGCSRSQISPSARESLSGEEDSGESSGPSEPNEEDIPHETLIHAAVSDVFAAADKLSTLDISLKKSYELTKSETNQLYSLLFCLFQDCELLLAKNRSAIPFSVHTEIFRIPNVKYENGVISHKHFPDGVNLSRISSTDAQALVDFLAFRWDISTRALPPVVQAACTLLKDPLVRSHNALRAVKQKISDLRKSNAGLTLQTRQVANRLVRISKAGRDVEADGTADKSDVIIHQQKLQKALTRVYNLREANETAAAANAELQARVGVEGGGGSKSTQPEQKVSPRMEELQRKVAELIASNEQSEEERETALAQRRVSLSRMNAAIQKAEEEVGRLRFRIADVDNRLRIMTQGQKGMDVTKGPPSRKGSGGSKIPVHHPERRPDS